MASLGHEKKDGRQGVFNDLLQGTLQSPPESLKADIMKLSLKVVVEVIGIQALNLNKTRINSFIPRRGAY